MRNRVFEMLTALAVLASFAGRPAEAVVPVTPTPIQNIDQFLEQCPSTDVAYPFVTTDFQIRRNGFVVALPSCTPPISTLPIAQYTDELIVLQGLRTVFHLSYATAGTLPWTSVNLYNWLNAKIDGFNIRDSASGSSCCELLEGKLFVTLAPQDNFNRNFDKRWEGIASNIDLYFHEARHVDGFLHASCCGIANGCDSSYTTNSLAPYAIQWWLHEAWLSGKLTAGLSCLNATRTQEVTSWHLASANNAFRDRFCSNVPPPLATPAQLGGPCGDANSSGAVDVADVFYLINFLFARGPRPARACDVNLSGATDVTDVFYLINFLFAGGPPPY